MVDSGEVLSGGPCKRGHVGAWVTRPKGSTFCRLCARELAIAKRRANGVKPRIVQSVDDRFFSKVRMTDGCWVWTAGRSTNQFGHGVFSVGRGVSKGAHRFMYEQVVGPIPEGCVLDHLCRNTSCVRPDHLEPVPQRVNLHRGTSPVAINAAKTECKRGHPLSGDNLIVTKTGCRQCRECRRTKDRLRRAARKQR